MAIITPGCGAGYGFLGATDFSTAAGPSGASCFGHDSVTMTEAAAAMCNGDGDGGCGDGGGCE